MEAGDESVKIYRRVEDAVVTQTVPFRRWLIATRKHNLPDAIWTRLEGDDFNWLAEFPNRTSYQNARFALRDSHAEFLSYPSPERQYLTRSGQTLFKGMSFDDVRRMQLDIETAGLSPDVPENEIFLISISDNTGFETSITGSEPEILRETIRVIREHDPDIIEGHNIIGFDLPYLSTRAKMHGIRLSLGRDNSQVSFGGSQNCQIGYFSRPYVPVYIHGRQVIDTLFAAQRHDVARSALSSYNLKAIARAFGIDEEDREIIPHDQILNEWKRNPDKVIKYGLQDVRETRSLAELVCPPEFYLSQMVPDTYARCATSGTGERINFLFIREYLRQGRAIPRQQEPKPLPGGYTEVRTTGLVEHIVKCDVESLYPSIMITQNIRPQKDVLDVFQPALRELTSRRIEAKRRARETTGREHAYWDGFQASVKILINSFYGYLGGPFNFNDYDAAAQVTTTGRQVVRQIAEALEKSGSLVVEIDTDGVYFKPPDSVDTEEAELEYIERIGSDLPEGIRLAHDGRYAAMISLKMKNYVLLDYDGKLIFRGSSLRSRADEPFGLDFISQASDLLLRGKKQEVKSLYQEISRQISSGTMPLEKFARRERITEKTFSSSGKQRLAKAAASAQVGDYVLVYERRDGSVALAQDYDNDEDRDYLLDKLYKFACRLREAFGDEFDLLFPKPSAKSRAEAAGQQTLGLFD